MMHLKVTSGEEGSGAKHVVGPSTHVYLNGEEISNYVYRVDVHPLKVGEPATAAIHLYLTRLEADLPEIAVEVRDLTHRPEQTTFRDRWRRWWGR